MEHASLNSRSEKVVRGGDGVDVTREVEIELVHRNNLTVASTSSTTLDAECGALAGLSDVGKGNAVQVGTKCLSET